ncbi:adenylyl cyclase-associated protein [Naematelia encephala]|uniref:Adenylyl cyclase-associated protein n=1 Tax=Naematelia encephala TaxID=71784 RepID=A0A1Y2AKD4_9TREE|nr:adenylyl cyclase-associated protein [Naematelia encephala]
MAVPPSQGMNSLSTLIKRLEAATSRLEDIATSQSHPAPSSSVRSPGSTGQDALSGLVTSSTPAPPPPPPPPPTAAVSLEAVISSPAIKAYEDEIIHTALAEFTAKAKDIGGIVEQHSLLLEPVCSTQLDYLKLASTHSKPSTPILALLKPQADAIQAVMEAKDKLGRGKEGREWGACLSTVAEGISAWGWVQVEPAPAPFVLEMKNAAQFWADRVTKQFKETDTRVVDWAKSFIALVDALQKYVKQWHTTGVTWNPKGSPAPTSVSASSATPPPPPPPPQANTSSAPAPASGQAALMAELNRGGAITSGLKKVDKSQMTHKNPELRTTSVVPDKKTPPPVKAKPQSITQAKPAKLELEDGSKWIVEYQEDNKEIIIDQTALHQTVHIFGCKNSVIRISGKINAVSMVASKKTSIVLESAVSSLSITSSPSFEVQITGSVPTIMVDTTDSGQIYLSEACMNMVEVITSKTSSINISVPTGEGGDFEERALPEQMKTKVVKGKLVTEIVEHAG